MQEVLPGRAGPGGVPAQDKGCVLAAGRSRYRAGIPWRDWPARCGAGKRGHTRVRRGAQGGGWEPMCPALAADTDNADAMRAATIVRAPSHRAGAHGGTGRQTPSGAAPADGPQSATPPALLWALRAVALCRQDRPMLWLGRRRACLF